MLKLVYVTSQPFEVAVPTIKQLKGHCYLHFQVLKCLYFSFKDEEENDEEEDSDEGTSKIKKAISYSAKFFISFTLVLFFMFRASQ